jgi:hypothetical protein
LPAKPAELGELGDWKPKTEFIYFLFQPATTTQNKN